MLFDENYIITVTMHTTQWWEEKFGPQEHPGNSPPDSTLTRGGESQCAFQSE